MKLQFIEFQPLQEDDVATSKNKKLSKFSLCKIFVIFSLIGVGLSSIDNERLWQAVTEAVMSFLSAKAHPNCPFSEFYDVLSPSSLEKTEITYHLPSRAPYHIHINIPSNTSPAIQFNLALPLTSMNNSRRNAKEPFEWNVSSSANISSSAKAEILEIQRQHENQEPIKDEFKFSEPRVNDSSVSKIAFCVSLDDDDDVKICMLKITQ